MVMAQCTTTPARLPHIRPCRPKIRTAHTALIPHYPCIRRSIITTTRTTRTTTITTITIIITTTTAQIRSTA